MWAKKSLWFIEKKKKKLLTQRECILNFTLYCQIALQSGCINLYSHNSSYCTIFSLVVLSVFLNLASVMDMELHLIIVLLGIYLITAEVDHLFKCLLTILVSSFLNCLFKVIVNFSIRLLVFPDFYELFIFFDTQPLREIYIPNIISQAVACHLTFFSHSDFYWSKVLNFSVVKLIRVFLCVCFLERYSLYHVINMWSFMLFNYIKDLFSSFIVFIHLELACVCVYAQAGPWSRSRIGIFGI